MCSLRVYDTPLEALQGSRPPPPQQQQDGAAGGGNGGKVAAAAAAAAGQRAPAQPPAHQLQQQEQDSFMPALHLKEGELLYDYCWYSRMSAADPASCCLAATGRGQPVHLWDACSGAPCRRRHRHRQSAVHCQHLITASAMERLPQPQTTTTS